MEKTKELMGDIVKQSIRNIICIDDEFTEPYEKVEADRKGLELSGKMYTALSTECECAVTMVSYHPGDTLEYLEKKMKQKDLLVIDWELTQSKRQEATIGVLNSALENRIPYICIYTNEQDTKGIEDILRAYYSGHDQKEVKRISELCENMGILKDEFVSIAKECFGGSRKDVKPLKAKMDELGIKVDKEQFNYDKPEEWYKLYLQWHGYILPPEKKFVADRECSGLEVDGRKFFFFTKNMGIVQNKPNVISPENIISEIVENIVQSPDSIKDGICLYYSNQFQEVLARRPNIFGDISYDAFAYYAKCLWEEDGQDAFELFIKGLYKQELEQQIDIKNAVVPKELSEELMKKEKQKGANLIPNELVQLNAKININGTLSEMDHCLSFGDVFQYSEGNGNGYLLCVTAKCDCRRPKKINNNYLFICGKKCNRDKALINAEKDYFSFLQDLDKKFITVEWNKKLNTVYIKDNMVMRGKEIEGNWMGEKCALKYICSLKDNYTQRMANMAYADGSRVGISLAHLPETSASTD